MESSPVDPRDVRRESDAQAYRVHVWDRPAGTDRMLRCEERHAVGAEDVSCVLGWAARRAGDRVVMLVGLALLQVAIAEGGSSLPRPVLHGIAVLLLVAAALTLVQLLRSRRALRSAGAPPR